MALLEAERIEVRFGGVHALQGVDLDVDAGMITGLIGPNGAGKTTLFNVVSGLQEPTEGRVSFDGQDVTGTRAVRRARLGIGRTFQRLEVFGSLSVRDNLRVAAEAREAWGGKDDTTPERVADELLERIRLSSLANTRADALPTGMLRIVELGRALAARPRLLLLDEPSSGLDENETDLLAELLLDLAREGLAVLLVEHDVELVMHVCAKIHVLDFGRIIAVGTPDEVRSDERVRAAYLGTGGADAA